MRPDVWEGISTTVHHDRLDARCATARPTTRLSGLWDCFEPTKPKLRPGNGRFLPRDSRAGATPVGHSTSGPIFDATCKIANRLWSVAPTCPGTRRHESCQGRGRLRRVRGPAIVSGKRA